MKFNLDTFNELMLEPPHFVGFALAGSFWWWDRVELTARTGGLNVTPDDSDIVLRFTIEQIIRISRVDSPYNNIPEYWARNMKWHCYGERVKIWSRTHGTR